MRSTSTARSSHTATNARSGTPAAGSTSPTPTTVNPCFSTTPRSPAIATRCGFCSRTSASSTRRSSCRVVDRSNRAEVLGELNPGLRVPTLVLDDGRPLGESNAILWYLGDGTQYVPDRRVRARSDAPVDVLRAVQPRAVHRGRALLARVLGNAGEIRDRVPERMKGGYAALDAMERTSTVGSSSSATATRSRTSRSTRTRTSRTRATSTSSAYPAIGAWLERVASSRAHVTIDAVTVAVRVRFAPSPTGSLHLGNALTAVGEPAIRRRARRCPRPPDRRHGSSADGRGRRGRDPR